MIRYQLRCSKSHEFEGWFRDSAAFDTQAKAGRLACPVCNTKKIEKAPMAPAVATQREPGRVGMAAMSPKAVRERLAALRKMVEETHEDVGRAFAEEARKIHYGEAEERGIYGDATLEEVKELTEEGIDVLPLPPAEQCDA
ncbi:MAG: DUF1178 family protein [Alphaproteobacteria bacterium]|nr:DUF1178 family protein [Alphaproteobacteria bacterium]